MWASRARLTAAVAVLMALLPGASGASPIAGAPSTGAPSTTVTLGRVSTFTASTTSRILFRLPRQVDFAKDFHASVSGPGRITGFKFKLASGKWFKAPTVEQTLLGLCMEPGCKPESRFDVPVFGLGFERYLPAGLYELYVIADGAPVTVSLKIDGLSGSVSGKPTPVDAEIRTLSPRVFDGPESVVYSSGGFTDLQGDEADYGFAGIWALGAPHVVTAAGECFYYKGSRVPPAPATFAPGCPTGDGEPYIWPAPGADGGLILTVSNYTCCPRGIGGWFASAARVHNRGGVALWIDF
ncbi:MAG: hypothetical protein M3345_06455 [Actinomycetota bacterium]|nr:hypothetical protein [Actinomycetota bacterium]